MSWTLSHYRIWRLPNDGVRVSRFPIALFTQETTLRAVRVLHRLQGQSNVCE